MKPHPTPDSVRKALGLSHLFLVTVTSSCVRVQAPRYVGLYTHALTLISASYFDSKEVS